MTIRVSPNIIPDLVIDIGNVQQQLNTADAQLASGRTINQPSDNPSGAAALVLNQDQQASVDTFQRNISDLTSNLQIADSALNSAVSTLNQAIFVGVEAGNSDLSDSDRQAIANQLVGIQNQLLAIANTSSAGNFLFSGTAVETQPFTLDSNSAAGVNYNGNSAVTSVEIANGNNAVINVPGNQLFLNSNGSVFGALQQLITAVQSNNVSGIASANVALGTAFTTFSTQRLQYGTTLNQLQSTNTFLSSESTQLSTQENNIDAADIAQTTTNFSQADVAYQTLLAAEGKILNLPNLINFLQ